MSESTIPKKALSGSFDRFFCRQPQGKDCRRDKKKRSVEETLAKISDLGEEPKKDRASRGENSADIITKTRPRGTQQRRKQRWQNHREQAEDTLRKANRRKEHVSGRQTPGHHESCEHEDKIGREKPGNRSLITKTLGTVARSEIPENRGEDDAE